MPEKLHAQISEAAITRGLASAGGLVGYPVPAHQPHDPREALSDGLRMLPKLHAQPVSPPEYPYVGEHEPRDENLGAP
jgi:hypothetical protein